MIKNDLGAAEARWHITMLCYHLGVGAMRRAIRMRSFDELAELEVAFPVEIEALPWQLAGMGLPDLEGPSALEVALPLITEELDRRERPAPKPSANSPIARMNSVDIIVAASQFTTLVPSGQHYKGRCPMHSERTPSFYVYPNQAKQRWWCYGACARGGDVADLFIAMAGREMPL